MCLSQKVVTKVSHQAKKIRASTKQHSQSCIYIFMAFKIRKLNIRNSEHLQLKRCRYPTLKKTYRKFLITQTKLVMRV